MKSGGRIINIGSALGESVGFGGMAPYAATKGAVRLFTQGLARELGPLGVTVNNVEPGPIDTELNPANGEWALGQKALVPLGRYGRPEEIAAMVAFVASAESSYINGSSLKVDGGMTVWEEHVMNLSGRTALVTGASRGIGRATALALAKAGAQVVVHYGRGAKEADAVVAEIRGGGGRAEAVSADLAAPDGPAKLAEQVRRIVGDRLDVLVANAGVSKSATFEQTTVEDFDHLYAVNVRAPFFVVQQLLPILGKDSSVVLVSSLAAHASVGTLAAYAATKGAVDTLVKHLASALGERGIRVKAVALGVVETEMSSFTKTEAGRDFALALQALKRVAQPSDIAEAIAFLASPDARWVTGDTLRVDGGSRL